MYTWKLLFYLVYCFLALDSLIQLGLTIVTLLPILYDISFFSLWLLYIPVVCIVFGYLLDAMCLVLGDLYYSIRG